MPDEQLEQPLSLEEEPLPPLLRMANIDITRLRLPEPHFGHFASEARLKVVSISNR